MKKGDGVKQALERISLFYSVTLLVTHSSYAIYFLSNFP